MYSCGADQRFCRRGSHARDCAQRLLSLAERTRQLKEVQRGWVNYFRLASLVGKLGTIDSWVRNRLRDRLAKRGYESLLDYYLKVRPEQTFMGISFTS